MATKIKDLKKYQWDFKDIYASQEEFEKAFKKVKSLLKKVLSYKGQIKKASADIFLKFIDAKTKMEKEVSKIGVYTAWFFADMQNIQKMKNYSKGKELIESSAPMLSWIGGELRELGEKKVLSYIRNSKKHSFLEDWFKEYFRLDKYHLKTSEEELLANFIKPLSGYGEIYINLVEADYKYPIINKDKNGPLKKPIKVTQTYALKQYTQSHPRDDQELRLTIFQKRARQYHEKASTIASIYLGKLSAETTTARLQGFKSALEAGMWADDMPLKLYKDFIKTAYDKKHLVYDYVKLHRTIMKTKGIRKYHLTDRKLYFEIPPKKDLEMSVENAIDIIKKATKFLGPDYAEAMKEALTPGRIDYFEKEGKSQGGFMVSQPGTPSYILMNWTNDINALFTLAHEAGHGAHSYLASKYQKYEYSQYPILLAEIASTFIEFIVLFYLLNQGGSTERSIYLKQGIITRLLTLYFGTAAESKFEWEARELVFNRQPVDKEVLAQIFDNTRMITDLYDKPNKDYSVINSNYLWSSTPHHFVTTFYLHKYALTTVVSCNLLQSYLKNGEAKGFVKLLKLGGRYSPLKAIKDTTGVDLSDIRTHDKLFELFEETLNDLKILLGQPGSNVK